jgi:PAS domain S-box-containing protein
MADFSRFLGRLIAGSYRRSAIQRYALSILLPVVALLLTLTVAGVGRIPYFPIFGLAVVVAAAYGGTWPGVFSTIITVLLEALVLLPPQWSLRVRDANHLLRLAVFAGTGVVVAFVIGAVGDLQRKLDNERERLRLTLAGIGDAVIATDRRGYITFFNPAAESATLWTREEALRQPLQAVFRIINENTRAVPEDLVRRVRRTGKVVALANHTLLIRKDGSEIPIDDNGAPILDSRGFTIGIVLVFRDITEKRQAEAALINNEKLASVGRLATTIAHELNNPLQSVLSLLYLASSQPGLNTAAREYLAKAQDELARAAHVAAKAMALSRTEKQEMLDISELANGMLDLYIPQSSAKGVNVFRRYRECPNVESSIGEVQHVAANLIGNALDALSAGGTLQLRVSTLVLGSRRVVRLTVADNGPGIAPEARREIFKPFYTTKNHVGTGLGLWTTRQIVEAHGGQIKVRSRLGKGTVFVVYWPAAGTIAQCGPAESTTVPDGTVADQITMCGTEPG